METSKSRVDPIIAGAVGGFTTRFLFQPLDVVKIRLQLQVEPINNRKIGKYTSISQTFLLIMKEEGISALWKGHVPAQLLSIAYGMVQFYCYESFMQLLKASVLGEQKDTMHFLAGAAAGVMATTVSFPFDTLRTRLVAQSNQNKVYKGIWHSCHSILRHESPRVFFYGLSPTVLQVGPHTGLQFLCYKKLSEVYNNCFTDGAYSIYGSLVAGGGAGLIAKTIVYPADLARKRLQIQGFEQGRYGFGEFFTCRGLYNCIWKTTKKEGLPGLFKGLIPSQLKAALTTALHFAVYEQAMIFLGNK